jgi:pimeloyl-ACP methyl ester carboxylesterase
MARKLRLKINGFISLLAFSSILLFTPVISFASVSLSQSDTLISKVESIKGISDVKSLESRHFNQKYTLFIDQPLDHDNPAAGRFRQRVFVMNIAQDRPTVIVTEGYGAGYVVNPAYREEISRLLDANIVFVEHRFFLASTPDDKNWKYLTAKNSAYDLHNVRKAFGDLYKGKWIATGISKGGQTALLYRAFFPNDVDITVPYVAPLCRGVEDGRHEPFLSKKAGTPQERALLYEFQREVLKRRAELQPKFDSLCEVKKYKFNIPLDEVYDFSVLEFPFAFWQWGSPVAEVPARGSSADVIFKYWMKISSPDYFVSETPVTPFFVQAGRELGYYGYDIKPFKGLLRLKKSKGYLDRIFIPDGAKTKFDKGLYRKLKRFVATTDKKIMFIYGEFDPWSAVMVNEPKKENVVLFIEPKGSHRARISTLPEEMKKEAVDILNNWLSQ